MLKSIVRCSSAFLVSFVLATSAALAAEQYQTEVTAIYSRFESGSDLRNTAYGPGVEWYFAPVDTTNHSYAEAAFLERIGSVFASVWKADFELGTLEADGPVYQIGINYTRPAFPFAFKAEAGYGDLDIDSGGDVTIKSHLLSAGYFFAKTLLAGIEYSREKEEVSLSTQYLKQTGYALFGKYVLELDGHRELNLEARLSREEFFDGTDELTNTAEEILVDYYPSRSLSIGAGIGNSSGQEDSKEGMTYSARARYFIVPQFSIEADYIKFLAAHAGDDDEKEFDVVLAARF